MSSSNAIDGNGLEWSKVEQDEMGWDRADGMGGKMKERKRWGKSKYILSFFQFYMYGWADVEAFAEQ